MATHSSILTWNIPSTEEPGRLYSMELQRVELGHYCHIHHTHTHTHTHTQTVSPKVFFIVVQSLNHVYLFCDFMDCSPSGSSVHGIFQARILECFAISFSRGSSPPRDQIHMSCIWQADSLPLNHLGTRAHRHSWGSTQSAKILPFSYSLRQHHNKCK